MARDRSKDIEFLDMPWPIAILAALSALLVLTVFTTRVFYKHYRVPSAAMQPTLNPGDLIIVDKFAYAGGKSPRYGDVIVFTTYEPQPVFVKRVIGLAGDTVQIRDSVVYVNGAPLKASQGGSAANANRDRDFATATYKLRTETHGDTSYDIFDAGVGPGDNTQLYEVPEDSLFVLGDHRDNSADSRYEMGGFGYAAEEQVIGKVVTMLRRDPSSGTYVFTPATPQTTPPAP